MRQSAIYAAWKGAVRMTREEIEIGVITDFFRKICVAAVKIHPGQMLKAGDIICIKGPHTYIEQTVESLEVDHQPVTEVGGGSEVGLLVTIPEAEGEEWPANIPRGGNTVFVIREG
jgi:hypothetical protein